MKQLRHLIADPEERQSIGTSLRKKRRWPLSSFRPNSELALRHVLEVELLSQTEMKYYFPRSELLKERVLGLTKSIIAVA